MAEAIRYRFSSGVTLLEMLVAVVISSVIIMGAGTLYQAAMVNYNVVRDVRENLYAGTQTSDRITEAVRKANPMCVWVRNDVVTPANSVLVYNYGTSAWQTTVQTFSGIVYAANEKLFRFENQIGTFAHPVPTTLAYTFTAVAGSDNFSPPPGGPMNDAALGTWIRSAVNQRRSDVIGFGVARFIASQNEVPWNPAGVRPMTRAITWTVDYLQAGRGQ